MLFGGLCFIAGGYLCSITERDPSYNTITLIALVLALIMTFANLWEKLEDK